MFTCIFMRVTFVFQVFPEANRAGLIGDSFNLARFLREREREKEREKVQLKKKSIQYFQYVNV